MELSPTFHHVALWRLGGSPAGSSSLNAPPADGDIRYQPYFCEENIWQLAADPAPGGGERAVLVVSGTGGTVACWEQRAGPDDGPILWDYHVVLLAGGPAWTIWDLDCRRGCPLPAAVWLAASFPFPDRIRLRHQPRFAWFSAAEWRNRFSSDRAHMRDGAGGWLQPPPPWPASQAGDLTLDLAIAAARQGCDLRGLAVRLRV